MNTQQVRTTRTVTFDDLKVNGGIVRPGELPMWVGMSNMESGGKRLRMSVSFEKEWYWLRFAIEGGQLDSVNHADMMARGYSFSKKRRFGYWIKSTPQAVRHIRALGFTQAQHIEAQPPAPVEVVRSNVEVPATHQVKGKTTTTVTDENPIITMLAARGIKRNASGRWVNEDGHFVAQSYIDQLVEKHTGTTPTLKAQPQAPKLIEVVEQPADTDNTWTAGDEAFDQGYADGIADGADENAPDVYTRRDLAAIAKMSEVQLAAEFGNSYIHGYLEGFESARPKPQPTRGFAARLAERGRK